MTVTLKNELLTVEIEDTGAQLACIRDKNGTNYLWPGNPKVWPRRAPLLFPFVGRLREGRYVLEGQTYTASIHGFCRDALFSASQKGPSEASFRLEDSPETREAYPFAFALTVTYRLEGNRLTKSHRVENRDVRRMYYELGGHDGYRVPLSPGEALEEYAVRLPGLAEICPYGMDEAGILTPKGRVFPLENGRISLTPAVYGLDTVILDRLPCRRAVLADGRDRPRITVEFEDYPCLGIWRADKPGADYICIEPWTSLPDAHFAGRALPEKIGVRALEPGQEETLSFSTVFHTDFDQ